MSAIQKAVDEIKRRIPREILQIVFNDQINSAGSNWRKAPISIDERILSEVIRSRVLVDADLVGGVETVVPLDGLEGYFFDQFTVMYEIPPELLNNRHIVSVKSIGYLPYAVTMNAFAAGVGVVGPSGVNDLSGAGQRLGDSASNIPPVSEANVDLVGYNTIVVRNFRRLTAAYVLRCMVSNDPNLNNIHPRSYLAFSKLCELAVKSHIYNKLIIQIDKAYLTGGQDLGAVRSYVESQSDAEEMYQTYLRETWSKVAVMNDTPAHTRFLKVQINPGI